MVVNSCLEDMKGTIRLKKMWKLVQQAEEKKTGGGGKWVDKVWKEQRVQDHKGGGRRQRPQTTCDGEVIGTSPKLHHRRFQ